MNSKGEFAYRDLPLEAVELQVSDTDGEHARRSVTVNAGLDQIGDVVLAESSPKDSDK